MTDRHSVVTFQRFRTEKLSAAQIDLVKQACRDGIDYHTQVCDAPREVRELVPIATWGQIGYVFGMNSETIFRHVTEEQWSDRLRGRPPGLSALELVSLPGSLLGQFTNQIPV
jgi:hypothetical protein